jgi:hypothetical protein
VVEPDEPPAASPVSVGPGQRADIAYNWSNWCGPDPTPLTVVLVLRSGVELRGGVTGPSGVAFVPRCDVASAPSHLAFIWGYELEASSTPPSG